MRSLVVLTTAWLLLAAAATGARQLQAGATTAGASSCSCALDGVSGGVQTNRIGCAQHLIEEGDTGRMGGQAVATGWTWDCRPAGC